MVDIKKELEKIIRAHLPSCKIMLYGSRARKTNKPGADYDIALDTGTGERIPFMTICAILSDIEDSEIPFFVDVVDVNSVSKEFLTSIQKDFVLWKQN
jgi:predicted nucleotidyltransferase